MKAKPHRLGHRAATEELNAGWGVMSIQWLLGDKGLGTTMIYARIHERAVADEFSSTVEEVERG